MSVVTRLHHTIPQVINISDIQRQPGKATDIKTGEYKIITKGGKEKAALLEINTFKQIMSLLHESPILPRPKVIKLSPSLQKKLSMLDPVTYQRSIREEY